MAVDSTENVSTPALYIKDKIQKKKKNELILRILYSIKCYDKLDYLC